MKHLFIWFIISYLACIFLPAQSIDAKIKYGEVSIEELERTKCSYVPEASAELFLSECYLEISKNAVDYYVHKRYKVYKSDGKKYANVKVYLYASGGSPHEIIQSLKGVCYNLENGEIVKTELEANDQHGNRINEYYNELNFVIPNVKVGSVFEFSYRKESKYHYNIEPWQLQFDIPVELNVFEYVIDNAFLYNIYLTGNISDGQNKSDSMGYYGNSGLLKSEICYPIYPEPFQPNMNEVYGKINFQFVRDNLERRDFSTTYNALSENLITDERFGKLLKNKGVLKALDLKEKEPNLAFAEEILNQLNLKVSSNGRIGKFSYNYGIQTVKQGEGSVADINLTYVRTLIEAGFNAAPILVSTRGNGKPHPTFADVNRFNYVIAGIKIADSWIAVDATTTLPFAALPLKLLNGNGYIVHKTENGWLNLNENRASNVSVFIKADLKQDSYTENVLLKYNKYKAYPYISYIKKNGIEKFKKYLLAQINDEITNITVSEQDYKKPFTIQFTYSQKFENKNPIYISPIKYAGLFKNPLEREIRYSSLNFDFYSTVKVAYSINYNDVWNLEQLPNHIKLVLANDKATFNYLTSKNGNTVDVVSKYKLNEICFPTNEYLVVKDFFEGMTNLNNEVLVLTRK